MSTLLADSRFGSVASTHAAATSDPAELPRCTCSDAPFASASFAAPGLNITACQGLKPGQGCQLKCLPTLVQSVQLTPTTVYTGNYMCTTAGYVA
jgi:hypothetical protein